MSIGPLQIAIIALLLIVLFGRGKISELMGDIGKGVTSFKKGIREGSEPVDVTPKVTENPAEEVTSKSESAEKQTD